MKVRVLSAVPERPGAPERQWFRNTEPYSELKAKQKDQKVK